MKTCTRNNPYKAVESLELDATELLDLFIGQIVERGVASNQRVERYVGHWPRPQSLLSIFYMLRCECTSDGSGDRPPNFTFQVREELVDNRGNNLVRHRKPAHSALHSRYRRAMRVIRRSLSEGRRSCWKD